MKKFKHYDWEISYDTIKSLMPIQDMLDVGCGYGEKIEIHKDLIEREITGLDMDVLRLKEAEKRGIKTVSGSALDLPFEDNSFDLVTSFHVIEHIKPGQVNIFIKEILRVLRPDGHFVIITPNRRRVTSFINMFLRLIKKNIRYPMNPDHKLEYTIEDLEKLFQNATEIKQIKISPIGLIRLPFLEISKIPKFLGRYRYSDQILIVGKKVK